MSPKVQIPLLLLLLLLAAALASARPQVDEPEEAREGEQKDEDNFDDPGFDDSGYAQPHSESADGLESRERPSEAREHADEPEEARDPDETQLAPRVGAGEPEAGPERAEPAELEAARGREEERPMAAAAAAEEQTGGQPEQEPAFEQTFYGAQAGSLVPAG